MEIWKTIKETDGKYSVSNFGNVRRNEHYTKVGPNKNHYFERILKQYITKDGYCVVRLQSSSGKALTRPVHRLVAIEFLENKNNFSQVNHKDENKQNNNVSNLEWCDEQYNANYGSRKERLRKHSGIRVAQYSPQGELVKIWDSISQASSNFGAKTTCCIRRVCKGERNTYRGFVWKYVDKKVIGDDLLKNQMYQNKQQLIKIIMNTFSKEELMEIINNYKTAGEK